MKHFLRIAIVVGGSAFSLCIAFAESAPLRGTVRDPSGAAVTGAVATIRWQKVSARTQTDSNGAFFFAKIPNAPASLDVTASGFADAHLSWNTIPNSPIKIQLRPTIVSEEVVVSSTRSEIRLSETPGSAVRLSNEDVTANPALTVDDILRQVPGFSLFRRSDSRTANPTSQGVSLRGLGASGPSRALVLKDGIPILDPFGSWVYWDRVPPIEISSVEVFRGGVSNLYGSDALGGVVEFVTKKTTRRAFSLETSYGNEKTPDFSAWVGDAIGRWDFQAATDLFRSGGYVLVPSSQRGSVDTAANSEHATADMGVGYKFGEDGRVFVRGNFYDEARNNGTPVQTNDTKIAEGSAGLDKQAGANDSLSLRLFGDAQGYNQKFSSIAADRNSEALTDIQHVPAQQTGMTAQWTHFLGQSQTLIGGADLQEVIGASDERLFSSGIHTANNAAGGRQRILGIFGEDIFRIRQWTVILGIRFDDWWNIEGSSVRTQVSVPGYPVATFFPDRSDTAFSPRFSVLRSFNPNISVTASIYRAFRTPTLNELYRSFRLGNVFTESNAQLRAETLTGGEAGMKFTGLDRKLDLRGTFFWSDIVNPVENVTLSTTPSLITRERENLGRTRSRGFELDSVIHLNQEIQVSAGYDYTDATVLSFPSSVSLQGLDIPQVPRHEFTWQARYWNPKLMLLSLQGRFVGRQFDDDLNQFSLDGFYAMDLLVAKSLSRHADLFAAVENLTNQQYMVARTPITNLGPPLLVRFGLRLNFPAIDVRH